MTRKLSPAMKDTLRIMREGRVIEKWGSGWIYVPWTRPIQHPHRNTVYAFRRHGLIESVKRQFFNECYALTEAGRKAEEELT